MDGSSCPLLQKTAKGGFASAGQVGFVIGLGVILLQDKNEEVGVLHQKKHAAVRKADGYTVDPGLLAVRMEGGVNGPGGGVFSGKKGAECVLFPE